MFFRTYLGSVTRCPRLLAHVAVPAAVLICGAPIQSVTAQQSYAPHFVTVTGTTNPNKAIISWVIDNQAQPIAFEIYRRVYTPSGPLHNHSWTMSHITASNKLTQVAGNALKVYEDTPVEAGIVLNYTVCALFANDVPKGCNPSGAQLVLNDNSFIPLANAPTNGTAVALGHQSMRVRWQDKSPNEDGFAIHRRQGSSTGPEIGRVGSNVTEWVNTGLNPDTKYDYQVCAIPPGAPNGTVCTSPFSGWTDPAPPPPLRPSRPSNVAAVAVSSNRIRLTWDNGQGGDPATSVEIRRPNGTRLIELGVPANSWDHAPLQPFSEYSYVVCRLNNIGERCADAVSARTLGLPPMLVSNLQGEASFTNNTHRIDLSWDDPNTLANGHIRTEVAKLSSTNSFITVASSNWTGSGQRLQKWSETGGPLKSNQSNRYRVCTIRLPQSGSSRDCAEVTVQTLDVGLDMAASTLRTHLAELQRLDVLFFRDDRRTPLPTGEQCLSCAWEVRMDPVKQVLERSRLSGEVTITLVDTRGSAVVELGRYTPDARGAFGSMPTTLMVPSRARVDGASLCGLTLRVSDSRGSTLGERAMCVQRGS